MIMISVMNRQLAKFLAFELPDAAGADMGEKLQGLFPVSCLAQLFFLAQSLQRSDVYRSFSGFGHITPFN